MTLSTNISNNTSNQRQSLPKLQNKYWALRHGQSKANVQKIISSHPDVSTVQHGLSPTGIQQAKNAGRELAAYFCEVATRDAAYFRGVVIVSSDYLRAKETAELVAGEIRNLSDNNLLHKNSIRIDTRLRERSFGFLHGTSDSNYHKVWEVDQNDADHTEWNVESVNSVLRRTTQLVCDLEEEFSPSSSTEGEAQPYWCIMLVAHGDVLQILQTGFANIDGRRHRSLPHLETATPRELNSST